MTVGYIDSHGSYYEGDRQGYDQIVPQRPSPKHVYENGVWVIDLTSLKNDKCVELDNARSESLASGVTYNGNTFDSDPASMSNVNHAISCVQAGVTLPTGFAWRSKDNVNVPFTAADLTGLATTLFNNSNTIYAKSFTLKDQVKSAQTVDDVNNIVWS